jgi:hypothetical protein
VGECISHAKPQRTRRGLNSVAEEIFSSEGAAKPQKAFSSRSSRVHVVEFSHSPPCEGVKGTSIIPSL